MADFTTPALLLSENFVTKFRNFVKLRW